MLFFKDCTDNMKRAILFEVYEEDGADKETALQTAMEVPDPDLVLRNYFNYEDKTVIE